MTTKDNKRAAREKLADERRKQAAADKRKRTVTNVVIAVVVVVAIVGVFIAVQNQRAGPKVTNAALPAQVSGQGDGMTFGNGPVTVDLWEDFQCPICKQFEATNGKMLDQKVKAGDITLVIHPLSFLDQNLNNDSSSLAANAFGCSAASGESVAFAYHSKLYEQQPEENPGTAAWSTDDLIGWGKDVGVDDPAWDSCVTDGTYADWVSSVASSQIDAGVTGTPTVFVNGQRWDSQANPDLETVINDAGN